MAPDNDSGYLEQIPVVCVVGPTASGKSALAQDIAFACKGEVLSADSMQIYRGMDIGTGKLSPFEQIVPHYGIDLVEPGEAYSAALFQEYGRGVIRDINERGAVPIVCGGTGFYVRAVIDDYQFPKGEQVDNPVREEYARYCEEHGNEALWQVLEQKDPESAAIVHPNNVRRVIRALEMLEEGTRYVVQVENLKSLPQVYPALFIGLDFEPAVLNARIDARVDAMIEDGLLDEVARLLQGGFRDGLTAPQAIGYKELVPVLESGAPLEEAIEEIKTATHRYAKRQRSWFKHDDRIVWLPGDSDTLAYDAIQLAFDFILSFQS